MLSMSIERSYQRKQTDEFNLFLITVHISLKQSFGTEQEYENLICSGMSCFAFACTTYFID